ncbi:ABC transporter [Rhodococcus sp. 15-649-1-2]|nr:ATP-binding cassette domain-containing protein [Rhodococcus sp. 15-649-1-2]OZE79478.1 ABC transporter [Rhodococcus sp. 15-649-1-2]
MKRSSAPLREDRPPSDTGPVSAQGSAVAGGGKLSVGGAVEGEPLLVLDNVSKSFPGVKALDAVSIVVFPGEVHGLIGENGAGKSTLMAVASGALEPDEGTVMINGEIIGADPQGARRAGLAIVRQEPALMPDLTVAENLYLGVSQDRRPSAAKMRSWAKERLAAWSSQITFDVDERVASLVPEHRFIVEIAKALAQEPSILVLDEPTEHLAAEDVTRLFENVRKLCSQGKSVVYISHRIREVREISNRVTVLRDGQAQGTHDTHSLTEQQIVDLIVGRAVDTTFPAKTGPSSDIAVLALSDFSGPGFDDVTLSVRPGEIIGFAGIDGNGQREALRALAGMTGATDRVEVAGKTVSVRGSNSAVDGGIVYLPGDRHREGIFAELTVRENFSVRSLTKYATAGFVRGSSESAAAKAAKAEFAVKTPSIETTIGSLSGGNQQKIVLASVLAAAPKVLLVDEPTQGVDIGARMEIYEQLRAVAAAGTAIVVRSSDATEVAGLCDRVFVFSRGKVVAELAGSDVTEVGITRSVLTATSTRDKRTRSAGGIWKWLDKDNAPAYLIGATIIGLAFYASVLSPFYATERNFSSILALVATLALVALGQQVLMMTGGIDLSVGPLMGLTVVIASFYLVDGTSPGLQLWGWIAIIGVALLVGLLNWALVELVGLHPMVATLATYMGIQAVSQTLRPTPGGLISAQITDAISAKIGFVPIAFLVVVIIALVLQFALYRTTWGLSLRAVGSRSEAARVVGVRPRLVRLSANLAASGLAGLAAILLMAQIGSGDASSGTNYTLQSIAAVVIGGASIFGGRGSFIGVVVGALLLTQVNAVTSFLNLSDAWQFYLLGGLTIIAVSAYSLSRKRAVAA